MSNILNIRSEKFIENRNKNKISMKQAIRSV